MLKSSPPMSTFVLYKWPYGMGKRLIFRTTFHTWSGVWSKIGFHILSSIDIFAGSFFVEHIWRWGYSPYHCRMFSSIHSLCTLETTSTSVVTTRNVSRHGEVFLIETHNLNKGRLQLPVLKANLQSLYSHLWLISLHSDSYWLLRKGNPGFSEY